MSAVLNVLLEITVYSLVLYGVIVLFQKVFHKQISAALNYAVWALLLLRMMIPVTIDSGLHLIILPAEQIQIAQGAETGNGSIDMAQKPNYLIPAQNQAEGTAADTITANATSNTGSGTKSQATAWKWDWQTGLALLWGAGVLGSSIFIAVLWIRLQQKIKRHGSAAPEQVSKLLEECKKEMGIKADIRVSIQDWLKSPALSTSFRPKLLLPEHMLQTMDRQQMEFGIRHELTHYQRKDHLMNLLLMALRCVYWFNPVIYFAFRRMQVDMEAACDARITAVLDTPARQHYIRTMLDLSSKASAQYMLGMGTCRGRKSMEKRVRGIFMKNKTRPTALLTAVFLAAVMLAGCFTTACQPTPSAPIIVNKNKDLVAEVQSTSTGSSHKLKDVIIPTGRYTYQSVNTAGSLTINVDAAIDKPETGKMPFARVRPMDFTQEMVTGMFNYLFPDEKPYLPHVFTKAELQNQILEFQQIVSSGKDHGQPLNEHNKANYEQMIQDLQKQQLAAPDQEQPRAISDGTLQKVERNNKTWYELKVSLDNKQYTSLTISTNKTTESDFGNSLWFVNARRAYTTDKMTSIAAGDALPKAAQGKLKIPLADAIAKADGFFKAAGINDIMLFGSYLVDDHGTGHVDDNWDPASHYAYKLYYTHTVNGVPVSCHESDSAGGNDYNVAWFYESIEFTIDDEGILEIKWDEPCSVSEMVQEDTDVIDFDTAIKAFEKNVGYIYGNYVQDSPDIKTTENVQIDHIQLGLVRLREKDKPDQKAGLYVPAYIFYGWVKEKQENKKDGSTYEGYKTGEGGGNDFYPGPMMVIAINAIDGSIINTMKLG